MSLPIGTPMPSLAGATEWLDDEAINNIHQGRSIVVQFWAVSCPICKMNIPHLQQLQQAYAVQGLRLLSVHMPRMEADTDIAKVRAAAAEMGLTGPCAIDNTHAIGDRFQTGGVWPCYFLFDAEGRLRSRAAGALGLKMAENSLKRLLGPVSTETESAGAAS